MVPGIGGGEREREREREQRWRWELFTSKAAPTYFRVDTGSICIDAGVHVHDVTDNLIGKTRIQTQGTPTRGLDEASEYADFGCCEDIEP
jgi:hypothetical protein